MSLQTDSMVARTRPGQSFRSFFTSSKRTDGRGVWARSLIQVIRHITRKPNEKPNHSQKVVMAAGDMFCFCHGALGVQTHGRTSAGRASEEGASGYQRTAAKSVAAKSPRA